MPLIHSYSEKETKNIGANLAKELVKKSKKESVAQIILLFGDLGSGKTAFVQGFASFFGVKRVLSPTFNIIKSYQAKHKSYTRLSHTDLYRIKSILELKNTGFFENLNKKGSITLIEWPNLIYRSLLRQQKNPKNTFLITKIYFKYGEQVNERIISYNE